MHTGPKAAKPLWENSRWVTGAWGGHKITTADELKCDIEARINCLINAFNVCRTNMSDRDKCATNYFMVPEFYFRCSSGPYPRLEIEGLRPYQYICKQLEEKLTELKFKDKEHWIIGAGSVLTCNQSHIEYFLKKAEVTERLEVLNHEIFKLGKENECLNQKASNRHIKALGYFGHVNVNSKSEPSQAMARINALMNEYRADPLCVVRNRGVLFKVGSAVKVEHWKYEKQNESTVDLTMGLCNSDGTLSHGNMITEWMAGYPSISIINGDKNTKSNPLGARITISDSALIEEKIEVGLEICLDHRLKRLRRTANMTQKNGAAADNPALNIQLIPSGGMQILAEAVTAGASGVIFNCDGCDPVLDEYNSCGKSIITGSDYTAQIACGTYAISTQTLVNSNEHEYYSHSQLSFRHGTQEIAGYNNALGLLNENGQTYDPETGVNKILAAYYPPERITIPNSCEDLYAAGLGELHVYEPNRSIVA